MKRIFWGLLIISFFIHSHAQPLISVDELASQLKSKNILIISTQSTKNYNAVHITNSINLYHKSLYQTNSELKGKLKDAGSLYSILSKKGIDPGKKIIIYDDKTGKYAARLFWILDFLGYPDIHILQGQMAAWKEKRKPVTAMAKQARKADVSSLKPDNSKLATFDEVKSAVENANVLLIDAREPEEYTGEKSSYNEKGHIPGAINIPYSKILKNGKFISQEKLKEVLEPYSSQFNKPIIVYCNTGILASSVYFALKYIAGYNQVKVYDGSVEEWLLKGGKLE